MFPAVGFHEGFSRGAPLAAPLDFYSREAWAAGCREVAVAPKRGCAVVHFPAALDGRTDGNAMHRAEAPESGEKYVLQQFVASCDRWRLDGSSMPDGRLSATTL